MTALQCADKTYETAGSLGHKFIYLIYFTCTACAHSPLTYIIDARSTAKNIHLQPPTQCG